MSVHFSHAKADDANPTTNSSTAITPILTLILSSYFANEDELILPDHSDMTDLITSRHRTASIFRR